MNLAYMQHTVINVADTGETYKSLFAGLKFFRAKNGSRDLNPDHVTTGQKIQCMLWRDHIQLWGYRL